MVTVCEYDLFLVVIGFRGKKQQHGKPDVMTSSALGGGVSGFSLIFLKYPTISLYPALLSNLGWTSKPL